MKTKFIPFDLETAKKIQAGTIEGKIKTRCRYDARILCTDLIGQAQPVLAAFLEGNSESVTHYTKRGQFYINGKSHEYDLILEVPDNEPQFKPFDKVLVRNPYITGSGAPIGTWIPGIFQYKNNYNHLYFVSGQNYWECIPYEGNEHLVETTDKPKED